MRGVRNRSFVMLMRRLWDPPPGWGLVAREADPVNRGLELSVPTPASGQGATGDECSQDGQ